LRVTVIAAATVTVLFGLSTIFAFGAATHRRASLSWHSSSANADLVQVMCYHGQFHLTINFLVLPGSSRSTEPRGWHAGADYLHSPGLDFDVGVSHHVSSRCGAGVYWNRNGPQFDVGLFGLYPTLLLWGLVWLIARRKGHEAGHCPKCGYDLRASPDRCPECGVGVKGK
jgi:hypothetical protein